MYCPTGFINSEDGNGDIVEGAWLEKPASHLHYRYYGMNIAYLNIPWVMVVVHWDQGILHLAVFVQIRSLAIALALARSFFSTAATCRPK